MSRRPLQPAGEARGRGARRHDRRRARPLDARWLAAGGSCSTSPRCGRAREYRLPLRRAGGVGLRPPAHGGGVRVAGVPAHRLVAGGRAAQPEPARPAGRRCRSSAERSPTPSTAGGCSSSPSWRWRPRSVGLALNAMRAVRPAVWPIFVCTAVAAGLAVDRRAGPHCRDPRRSCGREQVAAAAGAQPDPVPGGAGARPRRGRPRDRTASTSPRPTGSTPSTFGASLLALLRMRADAARGRRHPGRVRVDQGGLAVRAPPAGHPGRLPRRHQRHGVRHAAGAVPRARHRGVRRWAGHRRACSTPSPGIGAFIGAATAGWAATCADHGRAVLVAVLVVGRGHRRVRVGAVAAGGASRCSPSPGRPTSYRRCSGVRSSSCRCPTACGGASGRSTSPSSPAVPASETPNPGRWRRWREPARRWCRAAWPAWPGSPSSPGCCPSSALGSHLHQNQSRHEPRAAPRAPPPDDHVRLAGPRPRPRRRPGRVRHHGAVPDPGPHHPRRARRPRRVRQGQDRLGQDPGLRAAAAREHAQGRAAPPDGARARPHPRARRPGGRGARAARRAPRRPRRRRVRRGADRQAGPQARDRRRDRGGDPGPPHRPARSRHAGAVDAISLRRARRGRPHGRHGVPAPGRVGAAPCRRSAPDAAVLGHARRRGRRPRPALPARSRVPRGRVARCSPSRRWCTASSRSTRWTRSRWRPPSPGARPAR